MIDLDALTIVDKRVTQDLEDRREVFAREVSHIKEKMNAMGAFYSGATVKLISGAIGNEFRVRASLIWHAFARALDAKAVVLSNKITSEVKQRLADILDKHSPDLPKHHQELAGITRGPIFGKSVQELKKAALDRIFTEIDYALLKHSAPSEPGSSVVNVYQSYGIVQTGAGSSASLTINLDSEELSEIEKALESVKETLERSTSLASVERNQAFELVSDIKNEIKRAKPNLFRIRGAMQGLAMTIQTIASAPKAYQLLKGAASLLGLQLP